MRGFAVTVERLRKLITRRRLIFLGLCMSAVAIAGGFGLWALEKDVNLKLTGIGPAMLWSFSTVAAAGGTDVGPITTGGLLLRLVMRLAGTGFVGLFTAALATLFIDSLLREGRGLKPVRNHQHLLILGYNDKVSLIVTELRRETNEPVTLLADMPERPFEADGFTFVRGKPYEAESLAKAGLATATAAIILADTAEGPASDARTVLAALAVESTRPEVYTCVEALSARATEHLLRAGVDEILPTNSLVGSLLARSARHRGVISAVADLATAEKGSELYVLPPAPHLIGLRFGQALAAAYERHGAVLAGLKRGDQMLMSPGADTVVAADDELILIAQDRPSFR
jgi:voltage-gated potassium channel